MAPCPSIKRTDAGCPACPCRLSPSGPGVPAACCAARHFHHVKPHHPVSSFLQVLVYNFADLRLLHAIETLSNPSGLLALNPSADSAVLACPGLHAGQVGGCRCRWRCVFEQQAVGHSLATHTIPHPACPRLPRTNVGSGARI